MITKNVSRGFTLVEVAIVLVIAGLLIYMVSRNQGLVGSSQTKELIATITSIKEATSQFRSKYKAYPGDLPNANNLMSTMTGSDNGDGDGLIGTGDYDLVAKHLAASGLLPNATQLFAVQSQGAYRRIYLTSFALASSAQSPCSSGVAVSNAAPIPPLTNVILIEGITADAARAIDRDWDDEAFNAGKIRASAGYSSGTTVACFAVPLN